MYLSALQEKFLLNHLVTAELETANQMPTRLQKSLGYRGQFDASRQRLIDQFSLFEGQLLQQGMQLKKMAAISRRWQQHVYVHRETVR